jgi:PTS system mannose-specific IIC component
MVINMMKAPYLMPIFFLGFVFAAFTNFNLVAFGVIGLVIATVYIQLNPKYNQNQAFAAVAGTVSDDELD